MSHHFSRMIYVFALYLCAPLLWVSGTQLINDNTELLQLSLWWFVKHPSSAAQFYKTFTFFPQNQGVFIFPFKILFFFNDQNYTLAITFENMISILYP